MSIIKLGLFIIYSFSPAQVALPGKEIQKLRMEGMSNNQENFLEALRTGNSNEIFLLQMRYAIHGCPTCNLDFIFHF